MAHRRNALSVGTPLLDNTAVAFGVPWLTCGLAVLDEKFVDMEHPLGRNEIFQGTLSFLGLSCADHPKTIADAMNVNVNGNSRFPKSVHENTGGRFRSDSWKSHQIRGVPRNFSSIPCEQDGSDFFESPCLGLIKIHRSNQRFNLFHRGFSQGLHGWVFFQQCLGGLIRLGVPSPVGQQCPHQHTKCIPVRVPVPRAQSVHLRKRLEYTEELFSSQNVIPSQIDFLFHPTEAAMLLPTLVGCNRRVGFRKPLRPSSPVGQSRRPFH